MKAKSGYNFKTERLDVLVKHKQVLKQPFEINKL